MERSKSNGIDWRENSHYQAAPMTYYSTKTSSFPAVIRLRHA